MEIDSVFHPLKGLKSGLISQGAWSWLKSGYRVPNVLLISLPRRPSSSGSNHIRISQLITWLGSAPFEMSRRRVKQNSTNIEHEMESSIETSFESPPSSSMTFSSSLVSSTSNPSSYSNSSPPKNCPGTTKSLSGLLLSTPATPRTLVRRLSQRSKENCSPSPGRYNSPRWQRKGKS